MKIIILITSLLVLACGISSVSANTLPAQMSTQTPVLTPLPSPLPTREQPIRAQVLAAASVNVRDDIANVIGQKNNGEWVDVWGREGLWCIVNKSPKQVIICACLSGYGDGTAQSGCK